MRRISLSLLVVNALQSADVTTVDPASTVIIAGTARATPGGQPNLIGSVFGTPGGSCNPGAIILRW